MNIENIVSSKNDKIGVDLLADLLQIDRNL